jgi:hypothetical protein
MSAAASIVGGISQARAMKKVEKNLKLQQKQNQDWYNRRYNEDATQRADAQRALTMTQDALRAQNRQSAASAAVMGGTDESVALEKAQNASTIADTTSKIAATADARKDNIENQYMQTRSDLYGKQNELTMQKADNIAQSAKGVAQAAGQVASAFDPAEQVAQAAGAK